MSDFRGEAWQALEASVARDRARRGRWLKRARTLVTMFPLTLAALATTPAKYDVPRGSMFGGGVIQVVDGTSCVCTASKGHCTVRVSDGFALAQGDTLGAEIKIFCTN